VQSYNIDTADTWEFKTINIPANTSAAINNDTGIGWWIQWGLAAGTGIDGATLGSWHDNATEIFPTNQVNYMANTSYEFLLTGVQLEIGTFDNNTIPAFPFESQDVNLRKCCRYFQDYASFKLWTTALDGNTTTRLGGVFAFNTTMRAAPSVSKTNNTGTIDSQTITDKGYSVFAEKTDRGTTTNVTDIELDSEL